jgi:hypothetical protein
MKERHMPPPSQKPVRSTTGGAQKPTSRKQLTETEKREQILLAKIKRLNLKLSKVKAISVNMGSIASRTNEVSSRQVEDWSKKINVILNTDQ